jgi:L-alanine-DL-glutamate epimerase-like enolase superfamily enzyme
MTVRSRHGKRRAAIARKLSRPAHRGPALGGLSKDRRCDEHQARRQRPSHRTYRGLGLYGADRFPGVRRTLDLDRVRAARKTIGSDAELFVDANGAYSRKQALAFADAFAKFGVSWFEEPVSSDDLEGLRPLRKRAPAGMDIAAGEYGYDLFYFRRMLEAGAVDVLQADATRCAGITGFMRVSALCEAHSLPLSAHTAPSLHAHPCCALAPVRHMEYFHDHVRLEHMLLDGALTPMQSSHGYGS